MKIVVIHTDFRIYWPSRLNSFHEYLLKKGIQMQVIEIAGIGSPYSFENIKVDYPQWWYCLFPLKKIEELKPSYIKKILKKKLDELDPDIIITGAIAFPSGANAVNWSIKNKRKVIIFDDARLEDTKRPFWVDWIKRQIYSNVDAIFCPAPAWNNTYQYFGFDKKQIFYGVDVVDNDFWKNEIPYESDLKIPQDNILTIGRQIPKKNFLLLLKAYNIYSQKVKDPLSLVLVGNGIQKANLEEFVKKEGIKKVHFFNFHSQNLLRHFYKNSVLFVLPSKYGETWGLVVNEAMASGLPVMVSKQVGCASTLVYEGENGFTFSPEDVQELADLLINFNEISSEKRRQMRKASQKIITQWGLDRFNNGLFEAIKYVNNNKHRKKNILPSILLMLWKGRYHPV